MVPVLFIVKEGRMPDSVPVQGETQADRIERKLDAVHGLLAKLLKSLTEEEAEQATRTLDGDEAGAERDQTQSLG